jgi:hypothetical protein
MPSTAHLHVTLDQAQIEEIVRQHLRKRNAKKPTLQTVKVGDRLCHTPKFLDWLRIHGLDPAQIHTVDNINGEYLIAHGFARNAQGAKYYDHGRQQAAEFEPVVVRIQEPMPQ